MSVVNIQSAIKAAGAMNWDCEARNELHFAFCKLWLESFRGKEEGKGVQGSERGESGVAGGVGDAAAGASGGKQEAGEKRKAQAQPGQAAGGR